MTIEETNVSDSSPDIQLAQNNPDDLSIFGTKPEEHIPEGEKITSSVFPPYTESVVEDPALQPIPEIIQEDTDISEGGKAKNGAPRAKPVVPLSYSAESAEAPSFALRASEGPHFAFIHGQNPWSSAKADKIPIETNYKRLFALFSILFINILILSSVSRGFFKSESTASELTTGTPGLATPLTFGPAPQLNAHSYVVKIVGQDQPVLASRVRKSLPPASLTKLLTVVLAMETLLPEDKIFFSEEAKNTQEKLSPVKKGETVPRDQAVALTLVSSFNDAALAIAENIGKSRGGLNFKERLEIFKTLLNEKGNLIGLFGSEFQNPIGLDEDGHYASAQDLAKIGEYIWLNHPDLWEISRLAETTIKTNEGNTYRIDNTNELLKEFPAILGSKTGFTQKARGALLFLYPVRPDKTAIVVLLGSEDRFGDGKKIIQWLEENGTASK